MMAQKNLILVFSFWKVVQNILQDVPPAGVETKLPSKYNIVVTEE